MKRNLLTAVYGLAGFVVAAFSVVTVPAQAAPAKNDSVQSSQTVKEQPKDQPKPIQEVVVQPGDTLTAIAEAAQTTYVRLFSANTFIVDPNIIHPGDKLRVPAADEQLAERPLPSDDVAVVTAAVAAPAPAAPTAPVASSASASVWDRLASCESGGNWSISTGNGFYGGLQFTLATWQGLGGSGYPNQASRDEQISRAQMLLNRSGWGQWPACSARLGLR